MGKILAVLVLGCAQVPAATAQVDETALAQGRRLYDAHCALCHGASGAGAAPAVPALRGADRLGNASRVVLAIRAGGAGMPPFPALGAAETAALASYVRSAWTNGFGAVTAAEAAAVLDRFPDVGRPRRSGTACSPRPRRCAAGPCTRARAACATAGG